MASRLRLCSLVQLGSWGQGGGSLLRVPWYTSFACAESFLVSD